MEVACQAPLSVGFLRQEYWSGLLFPSSGDFLDPGIKPCLLHWQVDSLSLSHQESPKDVVCIYNGILLSHKKNEIMPFIVTDEPKDYHTV